MEVRCQCSSASLRGCRSIATRRNVVTDAPDRILRLKAVLERTGLTRSTLYRKIQCGTAPKPLRLSTSCGGWRQSAVGEWMRNPMFYSIENEGSS